MSYVTKYILPFHNDLNELYEIFFDFKDYAGGTPIELVGGEKVLTLRSTGGDEDKFSSIIGTECLIDIWVEENTPLTILDLIAEHDNDIRVTVYKDEDYTKSVFQGFIVVEDNSQPFLDPPFTLSVRALDGLGLLKKVDLVDTNGNAFVGSQTIISWIGQILHKTDQTLNIRTFFNFYNADYIETVSPLAETTINAITFKQAENPPSNDPSVDSAALNADDCYTALEKIVRNLRCRLFQEDGVWMLVNLYEYFNPDGYTGYEYELLAPVDGIVPVSTVATINNKNYNVPVGKQEIIHPTEDDAILYLKLATKFNKLTYDYNQSQNKICNQDLTSGDANATYDENISSSIIDSSITPVVTISTKGYDAYCFEHFDGPQTTNWLLFPHAPSARAFIREAVDGLGYPFLRFLVLECTSTSTFLRTTDVLVDSGDKISFSYDFRSRTPMFVTNIETCYVFFYGDDGSHYTLVADEANSSATTHWQVTDSNFHPLAGINWDFGLVGVGTNVWQHVTAGAVPILVPGSGKISIVFANLQTPTNEEWFKNISLTIYPYLNGSYTQVKGDYNFSGSSNDIKQTDLENVEISDSPKRYFKGALLNQDGLSLSPTLWHRKNHKADDGHIVNGVLVPGLRLTECMGRLIYNNSYRIIQKIEGSFRGLTYQDNDDFTVTKQAGYLNSYYFTDSDTPDKKFMLTSFEKDYATAEGRHVFIETKKDANDTGFIDPDIYKFSYIFQ